MSYQTRSKVTLTRNISEGCKSQPFGLQSRDRKSLISLRAEYKRDQTQKEFALSETQAFILTSIEVNCKLLTSTIPDRGTLIRLMHVE
jgi:hypothetical protein